MTSEGKKKLREITFKIQLIAEELRDVLEVETDNASTDEDREELDTIETVSDWMDQHNDDLKEILWEK